MKTWQRGGYQAHPFHPITEGIIEVGYASLGAYLEGLLAGTVRVVAIDGFHGLDWEVFRTRLDQAWKPTQALAWIPMEAYLHTPEALLRILEPFLGGDDPLFGRRWPLGIEPWFDPLRMAELQREVASFKAQNEVPLLIIYGTGAALADGIDQRWYLDVPKDTLQAHQRQGWLRSLGADQESDFASFYKRAYFVEWPGLNRHKDRLLPTLDLVIDAGNLDTANLDTPSFVKGSDFREKLLSALTHQPFRARPWFASGPWGGQFMKHHMGLNPEAPNYAWSFELIAPENGIVFGDDQHYFEVSFDWLLYQDAAGVMGDEAAIQFGKEWPIRFDYLDTIEGGDLSVQVHPRPEYIREHFGESITQDETYYIVQTEPGASVYLGFKEPVDPQAIQQSLKTSSREGQTWDVEAYVHKLPAKVHDLFMIPNGTIHCSGKGNLVLEISATPYIYTFKLYDYLRRDLQGRLRPINIERGAANLYWDRTAAWVDQHLVAKPKLVVETEDVQEWELMNIPQNFYLIHRVDFERECEWDTDHRSFMINLVEGEQIELVTEAGFRTRLSYLESMVIPARTGRVRIINRGKQACKLIKVFVKPGLGREIPLQIPT